MPTCHLLKIFWYYEKSSNKCIKFHGPCRITGNMFETEDKCNKICVENGKYIIKNSLQIPTKTVIERRRDNTMANRTCRKRTKSQIMIYKTFNRKLKVEQHKRNKNWVWYLVLWMDKHILLLKRKLLKQGSQVEIITSKSLYDLIVSYGISRICSVGRSHIPVILSSSMTYDLILGKSDAMYTTSTTSRNLQEHMCSFAPCF